MLTANGGGSFEAKRRIRDFIDGLFKEKLNSKLLDALTYYYHKTNLYSNNITPEMAKAKTIELFEKHEQGNLTELDCFSIFELMRKSRAL